MIGDLSISGSFEGHPRFQTRTTVSAGHHYVALLSLLMLAWCFLLPLESRAQTMAALTSPAPTSVLTGSSATFTWSAGTGASAYILYLGTLGQGSTNVYSSPSATTATSVTVTGIPTNGVILYATVLSKINGSWQSNYFTYTEAGTPAPAALTSPAPGAILSGSSVTFTWSKGSGPTAYILYLGTTGAGSTNLYSSPAATTATSVAVTGIPIVGATVYATLLSKIDGAWQAAHYVYTEAAPATLISPTPGTVLSGSSVTFTWTGSSPSTGYLLYLGTIEQGSSNIYSSPAATTATSVTVTGIPTGGVTLYVTVLTNLNGAWQHLYYTFTEAGTPVLAALTSPTPGSVLGSSATFTWSPGAGPTAYLLYLGTSGSGSSNLFDSGSTLATSVTANGIPASGAPVYVTLYSKIDGVWQNLKYTYTETTLTPKLTVSSTSVGFGNVTIGSPATQTVTLTSSGTAALTISSASATGTGFSMSGPSLPVTLNPGQTAALDVEFNPSATGTDSGLLTISSNSSTGSSTVVSLSGTAIAAAYQVNLAWNAPQNPPVTIAGYNVYRATGTSTTYQLLNTAIDGTTSYSDTTVQAGTAYSYYVESVDTAGVSSAPSSSYAVTVP